MIYITWLNYQRKYMSGIKNKIRQQTHAFASYFDDAKLICLLDGMAYLRSYDMNTVIDKKIAISLSDFYTVCREWIIKYGEKYVYMRSTFPVNEWELEFIHSIRDRNVKVVLEIPTYPYGDEIRNKRVKTEDLYYRNQLKDYIEVVTTYGRYDMVFGVPCIQLQNGVSLDGHLQRVPKKRCSQIELLSVAGNNVWHGYERVIKGLNEYYTTKHDLVYEIEYTVVGVGPVISEYKKMVEEYDISKYVHFVGYKQGAELDKFYQMADIGIGSLGMYKLGFENAAPIKLREYCARGLPFIYGYDDLGFTGNERYALKVSNDNTPISMEDVIQLYEDTVESQEVINMMRNDTKNRFVWEVILKPVVDYYLCSTD